MTTRRPRGTHTSALTAAHPAGTQGKFKTKGGNWAGFAMAVIAALALGFAAPAIAHQQTPQAITPAVQGQFENNAKKVVQNTEQMLPDAAVNKATNTGPTTSAVQQAVAAPNGNLDQSVPAAIFKDENTPAAFQDKVLNAVMKDETNQAAPGAGTWAVFLGNNVGGNLDFVALLKQNRFDAFDQFGELNFQNPAGQPTSSTTATPILARLQGYGSGGPMACLTNNMALDETRMAAFKSDGENVVVNKGEQGSMAAILKDDEFRLANNDSGALKDEGQVAFDVGGVFKFGNMVAHFDSGGAVFKVASFVARTANFGAGHQQLRA